MIYLVFCFQKNVLTACGGEVELLHRREGLQAGSVPRRTLARLALVRGSPLSPGGLAAFSGGSATELVSCLRTSGYIIGTNRDLQTV